MCEPDENAPSRFPAPRYHASELSYLMRRNNPNNEPTGPFTGRCPHCGSKDLWDDNLAYGCNQCKALLGTN